MCGVAPIPFTALAVWLGSHAVYSAACCVAWHFCGSQHLLCGWAPTLLTEVLRGFAPTQFKALAVWLGPFAVYSYCSVAGPLRRLYTLLAVWLGLYAVYRACCVVWPLCC